MHSHSTNDELEHAKILYEEILTIDSRDFKMLQFVSLIFEKHQYYELSLEAINKAVKLRSNDSYLYYNRAKILQKLQKNEQALADYTQAISLDNNFPEAYFKRAFLYQKLKLYEKALKDYTQAITLNPNFTLAYLNRGNIFKILNYYEKALENYNQAILLDGQFISAYANRANVLYELKCYDEALKNCEIALSLNPYLADAYCTKANVFKVLNRCTEALENYEKALQLNPLFVEAYCNQGNAFKALHRYDEAMQSYDKAIELNPNHPNAHRNKAILCMTLGDLKQGFELYEWRWIKDDLTSFKEAYAQPLWLGKEDLAHKTILIHSEQGFGDVIHFCRYLELLKKRGATVLFSIEKPLYSLLNEAMKSVAHCFIKGEPLPAFDYHCPLLSLPLAFQTTLQSIPHKTPYIDAKVEKVAFWQARLKSILRPKVGVVWRGNPLHNNDYNRSIALETLLPHLPQGFEYICLQNVLRDEERVLLEATPYLHYFGDDLHDFSDTAGLCACTDAVISVDTSVAHLAGAMHKTCIILLPYAADWRWFEGRDDSPWYPSVTLLRQRHLGDWQSCLSQLALTLKSSLN